MLKTTAIDLLGGKVSTAAKALGVTHSAISQWPEVLTTPMEGRVLVALTRQAQGIKQEPVRSVTARPDSSPIVEA
jgi:hypothetical protein